MLCGCYCVVAVIVKFLSESSMVQRIGLQCVIVAFPAHPHNLLAKIYDIEEIALKCN